MISISLWLALGPLAILQLGAWSWMIASYTQESSLKQAIRETFSDERPCEMCRLIDKVEEDHKDPAAPPSGKKDQSLKLMLGLERAIIVPKPASVLTRTRPVRREYSGLKYPVPTPPPRMCA
ncbi:MAG: hypothetical protein ACPGSB_08845 [Opitutales bacterium]